MQESFIFSDTIAANIAIGEDVIDKTRLAHAATIANISEFIQSLPLKYNTKIGMEGNGISQGQRQRILVARAVYKTRISCSSTKQPMLWMQTTSAKL